MLFWWLRHRRLRPRNAGDDLVFIVAADMRNFAADGEWSKNFSGACEAAKEIGPGAFMISPGDLDVDPPSAVREMIDRVLGEDYPWYPVLGNHDPESPSTMTYLREYSCDRAQYGSTRARRAARRPPFSFDWADTHFVVLNQYFDGVNDWGVEGDMVPELLEWLAADLAATEQEAHLRLRSRTVDSDARHGQRQDSPPGRFP